MKKLHIPLFEDFGTSPELFSVSTDDYNVVVEADYTVVVDIVEADTVNVRALTKQGIKYTQQHWGYEIFSKNEQQCRVVLDILGVEDYSFGNEDSGQSDIKLQHSLKDALNSLGRVEHSNLSNGLKQQAIELQKSIKSLLNQI